MSEKPDLADGVIREGRLEAWENEGGTLVKGVGVIKKHRESGPAG